MLERFDQGEVGEVWIREERADGLDAWPTIRVPRSSVVFLVATPAT